MHDTYIQFAFAFYHLNKMTAEIVQFLYNQGPGGRRGRLRPLRRARLRRHRGEERRHPPPGRLRRAQVLPGGLPRGASGPSLPRGGALSERRHPRPSRRGLSPGPRAGPSAAGRILVPSPDGRRRGGRRAWRPRNEGPSRVGSMESAGSKGPSLAFRPRPWKSPIKKREGRTCVRTHPACRPS